MTTSLFLTVNEPTPLLKYQVASVIQQSQAPDELFIIDGSGQKENEDRIVQMQTQASFAIEYLSFPTNSLLAKRLNTAIHLSKGDFLIVANGNGLFHPKCLYHHHQFSKRGMYLNGVISKITEMEHFEFSETFQNVLKKAKASGDAFYFPLRSHLTRSKSLFSTQDEIQNISFWREDFNLINGYDEDYETEVYTHYDLLSRLTHLGVKSKVLKGAAFMYQPNRIPKSLQHTQDISRFENSCLKKRIVARNGVEKN